MSVRRDHSLARTLAATLGALPAALALGLMLAVALPLDANLRYAIGAYAVVPLWCALACLTFLAQSGRRAWALVATLTVVALAVVAVRQ
jgi:hypothetical protein